MGTRNCLGNLTKSPGEEGEGVGGASKLTWAHIPLSHSRGGGGKYTPGRLMQQEPP